MKLELRPGEKLNALVVDDEDDIRETLKMFLQMMGIFTFIIEAKDGGDAYRKCQVQKFDLIITDLMMPVVKGIDFIRSYKAHEVREKMTENPTPIIILSANVTGAEVTKALKFGVKYVITKPCTAEQFIAKVTDVLIKHKRDKIKVIKEG